MDSLNQAARIPETEDLLTRAHGVFQDIARNIGRVMRGQDKAIQRLLASFAAGGHVLIEDVPGTGKTTLAKALARSVDARVTRVQFTPDLLPTDILGVSVFDSQKQAFVFHPGPVFTNILLADEINRASPRTQSALLEAMAERQVSVEGENRKLTGLFFVMGTQNPVESAGTYPLPEAQMDRFAMRFSLGYVDPDTEARVLSDQTGTHPLDSITPCAGIEDALNLQEAVRRVRISDEILRYMVTLVRATRDAEGVVLGASPRASLALMQTARALALFEGMDFVTPDHVKELAVPVIAHRTVLSPKARFAGQTARGLVEEILERTRAPA